MGAHGLIACVGVVGRESAMFLLFLKALWPKKSKEQQQCTNGGGGASELSDWNGGQVSAKNHAFS